MKQDENNTKKDGRAVDSKRKRRFVAFLGLLLLLLFLMVGKLNQENAPQVEHKPLSPKEIDRSQGSPSTPENTLSPESTIASFEKIPLPSPTSVQTAFQEDGSTPSFTPTPNATLASPPTTAPTPPTLTTVLVPTRLDPSIFTPNPEITPTITLTPEITPTMTPTPTPAPAGAGLLLDTIAAYAGETVAFTFSLVNGEGPYAALEASIQFPQGVVITSISGESCCLKDLS